MILRGQYYGEIDEEAAYQRSCKTTSHQILILKLFSDEDIFQLEGSRFKPKALDKATAAPIIPPLPNIEVLGLPQTLRIIAITVDIPGDKYNSECRASFAWTQIKRISGQRMTDNSGELSQYIRALAYKFDSKAGEILCF